jgi:hypothetical protein
MMKTKKLVKTFALIFFLAFALQTFSQQAGVISYPERGFVSSTPATQWEQALVSGNGKYGALIYGQPFDETIILNHARLFMPVHEPLPPVNTGAHLPEIRQMLADGQYQKAADFVVALSKAEGFGGKRWTDPFIPAFNIRVIMPPSGETKNYSRSVDFSTGETSVKWTDEKGTYQRRLFVSRADDAIVLSITGKKKGKVNCTLKLVQQLAKGAGGWAPDKMLENGIKEFQVDAEYNWLTYRSSFKKQWNGSLQGYEGVSRIVVRGGKTIPNGDSISVSGADEVLVFTKIELLHDYTNSQIENLKNSLSQINPDYKILLERHAKIHGAIFNRSRLDLGGGADRNLTSEELIAKSKFGNLNPAMLEKEYDAARYNILSSSGELFPNLQGIWSGTYGPAWSGDFTLNGNVECAISANLSANMAENMEPFFRFMETHIDDFRLNAKRMFNFRGIHVPSRASSHGLNNHFDETWPMTFWTAGAGWAAQFFFDYYLYTGDTDFLLNRAFPFMKEAALFYEDFLIEGSGGKLIFSPSYSPENHPANSPSQACVNATMDIGVARELLNNCIMAADILDSEDEKVKLWRTMLAKMPDYQINEKGAVKEWSTPLLDDNDAHRHASHLYALLNGLPEEIAANAALVKAFEVAMENRLELRRREFKGESVNGRPPGEMAFGIVQQGMTAASLRNANDCGVILDYLANSYWNSNLVTTHNPKAIFNTDLSGGFPALIIRMLADSQPGWIELLPAWPENLPSGKIEGVKLRGQIELKELEWKKNQITAILKSEIEQQVQLRMHREIESVTADIKEFVVRKDGGYYLDLPEKREVRITVSMK